METLFGEKSASLIPSGSKTFREWINGPINAPIPPRLEREEWEEWGRNILHINTVSKWKIAFWLAFGEHTWPDMYIQIAEDLGVEKKTLHNWASVARKFQNLPPAGNLSFGHCEALASRDLDNEDRELLMKEVSARSLTREETRALVKQYVANKQIPTRAEPQWTNGKYGADSPAERPQEPPQEAVRPITPILASVAPEEPSAPILPIEKAERFMTVPQNDDWNAVLTKALTEAGKDCMERFPVEGATPEAWAQALKRILAALYNAVELDAETMADLDWIVRHRKKKFPADTTITRESEAANSIRRRRQEIGRPL